MNNHVGSNTMYVMMNLIGNGGPTLFSYDKTTDAVTKVGPLFSSGAHASASTELWYFSATQPTKLYAPLGMDSKLYRYDVLARTFETVFDLDTNPALFGSGRYIWQMHSSADDSVHSFTVRNKADYADLGCGVYKESVRQFLYYPVSVPYDECQVDLSGRWLLIKASFSGIAGEDNRIIDLQTGAEKLLLDRDGAGGHSDNGYGYMVAADNWAPDNWSMKVWDFSLSPLKGIEVYKAASWTTGGPNHTSHLNAKPGVPAAQQYACGSGAGRTNDARGNELICFRLDGSYDTLIVAPIMTDFAAAGGVDDYGKLPKASVDVTGQYAVWTSNMGTNRMDAFIAKIPSQVLMGGTVPIPPVAVPTVSLTAPATGATVSGSTVTVLANASASVGIAGVQFKLDSSNLGSEVTSAPYVMSWNTTLAPNGAHALTAVARDIAGISLASAAVNVTVNNTAAPPPPPIPSGAQGVIWTSVVNATATGNSLQKTAGCDGCSDSGAVSVQTIASGDGYVELQASETTTWRAVGLSRVNAAPSTGSTDFALWFRQGGYVEVRENNAYRTDTTYATGDTFRVAVANNKVEYRKNGILFYTSAGTPIYPLVAVASLVSLNATLSKVMISQVVTADTTPPTVALTAPAAGATSSCTVVVSANASDNVGVASVQFKLDGSNLGSAVTASPYSISWNTTLASNGAHALTAMARDIAGNSAVSAAVNVTVSNAVTPVPASTVQDVIWTSPVKVTVTGNSLQKTAGCEGCADAGAVSSQTIASGDGYVELNASEINTSRAIGLTRPNIDTGITSIDFALMFRNASVEVRENGVYKTDTAYATGDKFRIAVVNNKVEYRKNGVVFHTSAGTPVYPLAVDTSLWSLNATLSKVVISQPPAIAVSSCTAAPAPTPAAPIVVNALVRTRL
jgi:endonuclease YncB( thermonuclease family)